jgi:hypothetical protein
MSRLLFYYYIKQCLLFSPAPVFFILGVLSLFHSTPMCGGYQYEMTVMWFLMSIAHSRIWVEYFEIKNCPKGCGCK